MYENIIDSMNKLIEELLKYRAEEMTEVQQYAMETNNTAMLSIVYLYYNDIMELSDIFEILVSSLNAINSYKKEFID